MPINSGYAQAVASVASDTVDYYVDEAMTLLDYGGAVADAGGGLLGFAVSAVRDPGAVVRAMVDGIVSDAVVVSGSPEAIFDLAAAGNWSRAVGRWVDGAAAAYRLAGVVVGPKVVQGVVGRGSRAVGRGVKAARASRAAGGGGTSAKSAVQGLKLQKQLANQELMGQLTSGGGKAIAGAGTKTPLRAAGRIARDHGGSAGDWAKVTSGSRTVRDGMSMEIHGYRNSVTGQLVELKTKIFQ